MAVTAHTERMTSMAPIALIAATDATRRAVRGAGPGDAVPERPRRRIRRPKAGRPAPAQSGSDQCNIVAVPRKPARA
jgi:hypothetical protein